MNQSEKVKKIARILQRYLPALSTVKLIDLAFKILESVESEDK